MTDLIARIDTLTNPACAECGTQLRENGPSAEFCGEDCAGRWRARFGLPVTSAVADPGGSVIGQPWLRSPITPPGTAVLIGGRCHGHVVGVPTPPRHMFEVIEATGAGDILFGHDTVTAEQVLYRLVAHNGAHWCYVDPRPAAPTRTVHVDGHTITIDYHHHDFLRDAWWVTISDRTRGVLAELPNEILVNDTAVSRWFSERGRPTSDGSWDITEQRPPFQT